MNISSVSNIDCTVFLLRLLVRMIKKALNNLFTRLVKFFLQHSLHHLLQRKGLTYHQHGRCKIFLIEEINLQSLNGMSVCSAVVVAIRRGVYTGEVLGDIKRQISFTHSHFAFWSASASWVGDTLIIGIQYNFTRSWSSRW